MPKPKTLVCALRACGTRGLKVIIVILVKNRNSNSVISSIIVINGSCHVDFTTIILVMILWW